MENDTEHFSFRVISVPLSKPFYAKNARTNQVILVLSGFIFTPLGILMLTAPDILVMGIVFIALGVGGFFSAVMIKFHLLFQTGDCPYCRKKITVKYRETQFKCPLCSKQINKTKTAIENVEPLIQFNTTNSFTSLHDSSNISTEPSISFDEMKRKFYGHWSLQIQSTSDQQKRFKRAKNETIYALRNINPDNGTAQCYSSNYDTTGIKYDVTYHSCSCPDYQKRLFPCKHIYALVINLGIMKDDTDLSGISSSVRGKIELLPPESLKSFKSILTQNKNYTPFLMKITPRNKPLLALRLVEDTEDISTLINLLFTRNDLVAKIYESNLDYKPNSKTTKEEIIRYITTSHEDFVKKIIKNNVLVTLSRDVVMNYKCIYSYYFESEENNCY